jgi:hemoglobin-like flavoprotein
MTDPKDRALIETSLELAAERCADLTPLVYARLFAGHPEMAALFWRDASGKIKGEMLARVFEAILDFIAERQYADHLIRASVLVHTEYDVPPHAFGTFFGVVAATVRDVLGADWTAQMDAAWRQVLADLDTCVGAAKLPA